MSDLVRLSVADRIWHGWESVSVSRSMEALSGAFTLSLADRWEPEGELLIVQPDMPCTLSLGGDVVISGHVDEVDMSIGSGQHTVSVSGRDASADLVDCSAIHEPGEWAGVTLLDIATRLAAPFGVRVSGAAGLLPGERFEKFAVQPGETAQAALERACRLRGVLAMADGMGGIVLSLPATARADEALVEGANVLSATARFSRRERHSHYLVRGQDAGSDDAWGEAAAHVRGEARDASLSRYRPLLITAEGRASTLTARDRARWEAVVRAGRAAQVSVTVAGWRQGSGALWPLNALVPVRIPTLRLEAELLITAVSLSLSESGSTTELALARPDAFAPQSAFVTPRPVVRAEPDPTPAAQPPEPSPVRERYR